MLLLKYKLSGAPGVNKLECISCSIQLFLSPRKQWSSPSLGPLPQTLASPVPSSLAGRWEPGWQLASRQLMPISVGLGGTVTCQVIFGQNLQEPSFSPWPKWPRYTCRMRIDVAMEIEQLFLVLSKSISLCDQAGVRKERNASSRERQEKGRVTAALYMLQKSNWLFLLRYTHTSLPLESKCLSLSSLFSPRFLSLSCSLSLPSLSLLLALFHPRL